MRALGAQEITAWVGPHVCGACYEVPEEMQARGRRGRAGEPSRPRHGARPSLDLGAGVRAQLERDGVEVVDVARCTRESADLYSYRRDGRSAGRLAGLVRLRSAGERPMSERRDQVAANLETVRGRIAAACADAGRDPAEVPLVVVTKFFPASDVRLLADLGVTDVGENRHQEAEAKAAECADLGLRWHFIGGLQSNKAAAVARTPTSSSRSTGPSWSRRLDRGRARPRARPVDCLLQVSLDPPGRRGARRRRPRRPARRWRPRSRRPRMLRLRGLMAVAPLGADPADGLHPAGRDPRRRSSPTTPTRPGCRPG